MDQRMHLEHVLDKLNIIATETRNADTLFDIYREWATMTMPQLKTSIIQTADVVGVVYSNANMNFQ